MLRAENLSHRVLFSLGIIASAVLLLACSSDTYVPEGLPDGNPGLALSLVEEKNALILDVRTPQEFEQGRIQGAQNIPIDQLQSRLKEVDSLTGGDRKRPIIVYCTAGVRAARAKRILLDAGYSQVTNLGGLRDWPLNGE